MDKDLKRKIKSELFKKDKELAKHIELQETNDHLEELKHKTEEGNKTIVDTLKDIAPQIIKSSDNHRDLIDNILLSIKAVKGDKGETGLDGLNGEQGPQGEKGDKGDKGDDGDDGENGKDGIDGKDGSLDTAEQIAEKINTLNEAIDYKVLKNIPIQSVKDIIAEMKKLDINDRLDISDIRNWNQPARGRQDMRWHGGGVSFGTATLTKYSVVLAGTSTTPLLQVSSLGTIGQILTSNGPGLAPTWQNGSGGTGTVTSVTSIDGSITVTNPTTTPDLSVVSSPKLTTARTIGGVSFDGTANITVASATGGFTISGGDLALGTNNITITGSIGSTGSRVTKGWFTDLQVTNAIVGSITGNAGTATALATGRTISITGDLAYTSPSFDGTGNVTAAGTLATVNSNVGSFTNASITVNGKGLITAASSGTAPVTSVSGTSNRITSTGGTTPVIDIAATYVGQSSITTLGTITTGVWTGTTIAIANGGTGQTTASAAFNALSPMTTGGDIIYGGASGVGTRLANGSSGQVLTSSGGTSAPTWQTPTTGTVTSVSGTTNRITSTGGSTPVIDISASYVGQSSITTLGTITTGTWNGTKIGLAYGGTNADLSATGGTSQVLKQTSSGAAITVAQLAASDLSNGTTGSGSVVLATSPTLTTAALGSSTATTQSPGDNSTKVATTAYVDAAVLGQNFKEACKYATTTALPSLVYNNGSSGVGATLTGAGFGALSIDGNTPSVGDRILVKNQVSTFQNGIYVVTTVGGVATLFVLTRSTDANQTQEFKTGDSVFITSGSTLSTTTWAYNGADNPTIGTDAITYVQVAGQGSFTAGNGISITGVSIAIDTSVTVDKTTVQTLTNKTLTSPIISQIYGGTGASSTVTISGTSNGSPSNAYVILNGAGEGNVGIGTTTPQYILDITQTQNSASRFQMTNANNSTAAQVLWQLINDASNSLQIGMTSSGFTTSGLSVAGQGFIQANQGPLLIQAVGSNPIKFGTNSLERMRIDSGGNIGIKNTSPGALLDIGTAGSVLGTLRLEGNTSGYVQINSSAAAGSWTMTLPTSAGSANQFLKTDGSGVTTWTNPVSYAVASSGGTTTGPILTLTSTETQAVGDAVQIDSSGHAHLAKADVIADASVVLLAAAAVTGSGSNTYLLPGGTCKLASSPSWTVGGLVFLSTTGTTGNTLTQTAPSSTNNVVQVIGVALAADTLLFLPSLSQVEHT